MASMNLVYRPSTREGRHAGSLSLRLIHNRQVKTIILKGCRLYPDEWDRATQRVVFPSDNPARAEYLEKVELKIDSETGTIGGFILALEEKGRYSLDDLLEMYRDRNDEGTLPGYVGGLVRTMEARGQKRTARAYLTVARGLARFIRDEHLPLSKINACLIKDFETHLKSLGRLPNTISYYMRNLRAIYNKAVADKWIPQKDESPFAGVFTGVVKTMKRSLTLDEAKTLLDLDPEAAPADKKPDSRGRDYLKRLSVARCYFSFCLYARGMCFVDLAYLKKSDIRGGFIRYIRKKTGQQLEVRVTERMQAIIDSFAKDTAGSPYVFPIIRDPDRPAYLQYENGLRVQNNRLKRLATLAGINKRLSTHWARHTWANVGKSIHLPTTVIGEGLGHTSENTTLLYLSRLDNRVLDEANDLIALTINRHKVGIPRTARI